MRLIPSVLLIALLAAPALAGESSHSQQIAAIRALYGELAELEALEFDGPPTATMELQQVVPATGPQTVKLAFTLGEHRADEEQIHADLYVRKVTASWNFAAQQYTGEYLFSGLEPELVFHFSTDGVEELRLYFHEGELIRLLRKTAGQPGSQSKDSGFTAEELGAAGLVQKRAARLLEAYQSTRQAADGQLGSR